MDIFKVGELTNDQALTAIAFSIFQVSIHNIISPYHSCPKHVVIGKKIPSQSNDKFVNLVNREPFFIEIEKKY